MNRRFWHALGRIALPVAAVAMAACSSTSTTSSGTPADAGADTSTEPKRAVVKDAGTSTGTADADVTPEPEPDPDLACAESSTQDDCVQCFAENHRAGYKTFQDAIAECACQTGTQFCGTVCAGTFCPTVTAQPKPECLTCLQGTLSSPDGGQGACVPAVSSACQADDDCMAYIQGSNEVCSKLP